MVVQQDLCLSPFISLERNVSEACFCNSPFFLADDFVGTAFIIESLCLGPARFGGFLYTLLGDVFDND